MNYRSRTIITAFLIVLLCGGANVVHAAGSSDLLSCLQDMTLPTVDTTDVWDIQNLTLTAPDFALTMTEGRFFFYKPVFIDSVPLYWGGVYEGTGYFGFTPTLPMEQSQLRLFHGSDSLYRELRATELLFNDSTASFIREHATPTTRFPTSYDAKEQERLHDFLTRDEAYTYLFEVLRNVTYPQRRAFLMVNTELDKGGQNFYIFNPYLREEVRLLKEYRQAIASLYMETVCSYSVYATGSDRMLNGIKRIRIKPRHYDITAELESGGDLVAAVNMDFEAASNNTQQVVLHLHKDLKIDSILSDAGEPVHYVRATKFSNRNDSLFVFLPRVLNNEERSTLRFFYRGRMQDDEVESYIIHAGGNWYPSHDRYEAATFDINFVTPEQFTFACAGERKSERMENGKRYSRYVIAAPAPRVAFCLGQFDEYEYATDIAAIDILISDALHQEKRRKLNGEMRFGDRHMEQQVADDVSGALRLFSAQFGAYPFERLLVSESVDHTGRSFPGQVHLSWESIYHADLWGSNRLRRATAVAGQWWGAGVLYDGYRDRWLAEALSIYSGLMYLQASEGNDRFFWWLDEYKKEILHRHKYFQKDRPDAAPAIALGSRVACSETEFASMNLADFREAGSRKVQKTMADRASVEDGIVRLNEPSPILADTRDDEEEDPFAFASRERPDTTLKDYDRVVYNKGAYVIHMLRNMLMDMETLDDTRFLEMLREYYDLFYGSRATTYQFRLLTEKYCGMKMDWFFDQWVYGNAIPTYTFSYDLEERDGYYYATCEIRQEDVPEDFQMFVPLEIEFDTGGRHYMRLLIDAPVKTITLPPIESKPREIRLNPFNGVLARVKD